MRYCAFGIGILVGSFMSIGSSNSQELFDIRHRELASPNPLIYTVCLGHDMSGHVYGEPFVWGGGYDSMIYEAADGLLGKVRHAVMLVAADCLDEFMQSYAQTARSVSGAEVETLIVRR